MRSATLYKIHAFHTTPNTRSYKGISKAFTLFLALWFSTTALATEQWTLAKEKNDVQLYTQDVAGSEFLAIKATTVVTASAEGVAAALGNGEGCGEWRSMCKSSEVVEVVSQEERIIHMVLDLPWPISDRDVVMRSLTQVDEPAQTVTVELNSVTGAVPMQKQIRAQCNGKFIIKALSEGQMEINYIMHADLGGDLSADLVKSRQVSSTLSEMQALRELAQNYSPAAR